VRTETPGRSRRLLTFRLDGELRQRLKTRLAGEGRTMSEVVILGLQLYVQRSAWLSGPGLDPAADAPSEVADAAKALAAGGISGTAGAPKVAEVTGTAGAPKVAEVTGAHKVAEVSGTAGVLKVAEVIETAEVSEIDEATVPAGARARGTTAVASVGDLVLPDQTAAYLRDLRQSGNSDLLSAALAALHDAGWPLRPLAEALGISKQAVQARIRQPVPAALRSRLPAVPPPSAFPRRRPALATGRRPHLTVKIDHALRSAAQRKAVREGSSLSQVIEKILDYYLRHGMPSGEVYLDDTTPTRPARRRKRRT
jgi:hypothetical protein